MKDIIHDIQVFCYLKVFLVLAFLIRIIFLNGPYSELIHCKNLWVPFYYFALFKLSFQTNPLFSTKHFKILKQIMEELRMHARVPIL